MRLHGFFRSTASWRVRIALGLKGLPFDQAAYHLRKGQQRSQAYLALNPQGLVPSLELDDGATLVQSLAICEYLDEIAPDPPLLPADPLQRAHVRALAHLVACDIHPVQNLKVLLRLQAMGLDAHASDGWARAVIEEGLAAYETRISAMPGRFSWGDEPTLADICLVPQLGNARRFGVALGPYPAILGVDDACREIPAFAAAVPERQPDAENVA